jgi:hypothetical protein
MRHYTAIKGRTITGLNPRELVTIDVMELQRLRACEHAWGSVYMAVSETHRETVMTLGLTGEEGVVRAIRQLQGKA